MDKAIRNMNRPGKVDRSTAVKERVFNRDVVKLSPRTFIETQINTIVLDMNRYRRSIDVNVAIDMYTNLRNLRHEVWIEFINQNSIVKGEIGDIKVGEFIKELNNPNIDINNIDKKIMNLTPDILVWSPDKTHIIVGDLSVTASVQAAVTRKYIKYKVVADLLKSYNYTVKHVDVIISESHGNVEQVVQDMIKDNLINPTHSAIKRVMEYSSSCTINMGLIRNRTVNNKEFMERLSMIDEIEQSNESPIVVSEWITDEYKVNRIDPILSEEQIGYMLVEQTESMINSGFFDSNLQQSLDKMEDIKEKNRLRKHMEPKASTKICDNSLDVEENTNHNLVHDYVDDLTYNYNNRDDADYLLALLPNKTQITEMSKRYDDRSNKTKDKVNNVYGPYQYRMNRTSSNYKMMCIVNQLKYNKGNRNKKEEPRTVDPDNYNASCSRIEKMISYYGKESLKPEFTDNKWSEIGEENESTRDCYEMYKKVKKTTGAQLGNSLSALYQRIVHLKTSLGAHDNFFVPPNASFIAIIPKDHAPVSSSQCDIPFIFITRYKNTHKGSLKTDIDIEYEDYAVTNDYTYVASKLFRLDVSKINHWNQAGFKIIATATYICSTCKPLERNWERVTGLITMLTIDSHQKMSEYLDLLKYVSFMPHADVHRLSSLIEDKFDLLIKTSFDVWIFEYLGKFIKKLSEIEKIEAKKPKAYLFNNQLTRDSLGITMSLPSFVSLDDRHPSVESFIEEIIMLYIIRPKMLYGSQFMDRSINDTVTWNEQYVNEVEDYGSWATDGKYHMNDDGSIMTFPFGSKFCYMQDAIIYAMDYCDVNRPVDSKKVLNDLARSKANSYMHTNCSLRGCVKTIEGRRNVNDFHSTSMAECLKYYKNNNYIDEKCTAYAIAEKGIKERTTQQYAQSEKEQRGGGRPISTPDLITKAELMMLEKPEEAIGKHVANNIIVSGKNKLKAMSDAYKELIVDGSNYGKKYVFQLTEDQTKFSENDNARKYVTYINNNTLLPKDMRSVQLAIIEKINNREMLVHRLPKSIVDNPKLAKYINKDRNGVKAIIGWPQGMLNFMSTSIHSIADKWITYMYNKMYGNNKVVTSGLVHSDDSWVAVACDSVEEFKRFVVFRKNAKELFCLKMNIKKLWGSKYLGELVSNYNLNGNVHLSVARCVANCFNNIKFINWVMDSHSQISSIQQAYRNGANIGTIILLSNLLRQQIMSNYNIKGTQRDLIHELPIELGGYPNCSAFELAVNGTQSHYDKLVKMIKTDPLSPPSLIILRACMMSITTTKIELRGEDPDKQYIDRNDTNYKVTSKYLICLNKNNSNEDDDNKLPDFKIQDDDYVSITIPIKGEIFNCVKHIMPKTTKVKETIKAIDSLPYEKSEIPMIIRRPKDIVTSLQNLKASTSTLMYTLASENYTQQSRRMAVNQAIQASGKTIRLPGMKPMTVSDMLDFFKDGSKMSCCSIETIINAFTDDSGVSDLTNAIVNRSTLTPIGTDKRKIINKQPEPVNNFITHCRLDNVLMFIIDRSYRTKYLSKYGIKVEPLDLLSESSEIIKKRFASLFSYFSPKYACNLIAQMNLSTNVKKLWTQPYCRNDSMQSFLQDLYGKTISPEFNFKVEIDIQFSNAHINDVNKIESIYTVLCLNSIYEDKFKILDYDGRKPADVIKEIDVINMSDDIKFKAGVIRATTENNYVMLDDFVKNRTSHFYYTKPQYRDPVTGKYTGNFTAMVKYGGTILKVEGEEENITLTSSTSNISEILSGMMDFVNKNFTMYTYRHPNQWSQSAFWRNKLGYGSVYLNSYSFGTTIISNKKSINSLPIKINKNLMFTCSYMRINVDKYEIEENLRVVYACYIESGVAKRTRVGSLRQTMKCPDVSKITVEEDIINGLSTNMLLKSKAIISITTRKFRDTSMADYLDIIRKSTAGLGPAYLAYLWIHLLSSLKSSIELPAITHEMIKSISNVTEIIDVELSGMDVELFISEHEQVEPEDLTTTIVDYAITPESRTGSLCKYSDVKIAICEVLTAGISYNDVSDIFYRVVSNKYMKEMIIDTLKQPLESIADKLDDALEYGIDVEISLSTTVLVLGKRLYDEEVWSNIKLKDYLKEGYCIVNSESLRGYSRSMIKDLMSLIYDVDGSFDEPNELLDLID